MTNRLVAVFVVVLACSCGRSGEGERARPEAKPARAAVPQTARPALVFLGDSLTAGLGLPADETMPSIVQRKLEEAGLNYKVINAGRSGDTTAGGVGRLSWYLTKEVNPAALVIGLGSNDAMRGLPLDQLEENLRVIIRQTKAFDDHAKIFLFQMLTFPNMGKDFAGAYKEIFPRVASEEGITLLPFPLEGIAGVPSLNQRDGVHPNTEGMKRMADAVFEALRPHLSD